VSARLEVTDVVIENLFLKYYIVVVFSLSYAYRKTLLSDAASLLKILNRQACITSQKLRTLQARVVMLHRYLNY